MTFVGVTLPVKSVCPGDCPSTEILKLYVWFTGSVTTLGAIVRTSTCLAVKLMLTSVDMGVLQRKSHEIPRFNIVVLSRLL